MKTVANFKIWIDRINFIMTSAIIVAGMYTTAFIEWKDWYNGLVLTSILFFVVALCFKSLLIGISRTLVIISQDLSILARDAKIAEAKRTRYKN